MYLDNFTRPVYEPLDCSLVNLLSLPKVVSSELDPSSSVTGGWEIGCSSAADGPIVLAVCVEVPKRSFYEDLVVV